MALNINPALYWMIGGLATAGGIGYVVVEQNSNKPAEQVAILEQPKKESEKPDVKVPEVETSALKPETEKTPDPEAKPAIEPPAFHILRVEKDGSAVIAGTALSNSQVDLLDGDTVIASSKAGPDGDFAIVLDKPLSPGPHELAIRSTPNEGEPVYSVETGIINVPDGGDDLIAMVTKPGEASRIIQKPEMPKVAEEVKSEAGAETDSTEAKPEETVSQTEESAVEKVEESAGETVKAETKDTPDTTSEAEPEQAKEQTEPVAEPTEVAKLDEPEADTEPKITEEAEPQAAAPQTQETTSESNTAQSESGEEKPDEDQNQELASLDTKPAEPAEPEAAQIPVLIEAAEVEGDKIFIAGTGEPGAVVNLYMDGKYIGSTTVGVEGAYLFEGSGGLKAGRYAVRADMTALNSADVKARAEVSLLHQPVEVAEATSQPEPQKSTETVSADTESSATETAAGNETKEAQTTTPQSDSTVQQVDTAQEDTGETDETQPVSVAEAEVKVEETVDETAPAPALSGENGVSAAKVEPNASEASKSAETPATSISQDDNRVAESAKPEISDASGNQQQASAEPQGEPKADVKTEPSQSSSTQGSSQAIVDTEAKPEVSASPQDVAESQTPKVEEVKPEKEMSLEPATETQIAAAPEPEKTEPVEAQTEVEQAETTAQDEGEAMQKQAPATTDQQPEQNVAAVDPEQTGLKEIVTGSSVIIRRGDNLWRVSRRKWGRGIRYTVIFEANRDQIRDPHWIYPGQVFKIPEIADSADDENSG